MRTFLSLLRSFNVLIATIWQSKVHGTVRMLHISLLKAVKLYVNYLLYCPATSSLSSFVGFYYTYTNIRTVQ